MSAVPEMDLHHIKQILDLVREHELSEFEIENEGLRLKIRRRTSDFARRQIGRAVSAVHGTRSSALAQSGSERGFVEGQRCHVIGPVVDGR